MREEQRRPGSTSRCPQQKTTETLWLISERSTGQISNFFAGKELYLLRNPEARARGIVTFYKDELTFILTSSVAASRQIRSTLRC